MERAWLALPVTNRLLPTVEIIEGMLEPELRLATWSARRPPQPVVDGAFESEACHCSCWSRCENRLCGRAVFVVLYRVGVIGATSVPTFVTTARLLAFHIACRPLAAPSAGCRPRVAVPVLSTSGSRLACGSAICGRAAA